MYFFDCFKHIVTEMTIYHWFGIFKKNNYKGHIGNIQIKYTIIIIIQYTTAENVPFIIQFQKIVIKSISITRPINFGCRIINNPPCIYYNNLIHLPITGWFLKLCFFAPNRLINKRALFEVISLIKIHSTPHPGLWQSLTLTGYNSGLR